MTLHEEWTDKLSEYLDDELTANERADVDAHLKSCRECADVLNDLKRVVARAQAAAAGGRPPQTDLWPGVAARIDGVRQPRQFAFTVSQLAAAGVLLAIASGTFAIKLLAPSGMPPAPGTVVVAPAPASSAAAAARIETVGLADVQYDAAVSDLEQALKQGHGKLDASTIAIVERNLEIIDHAIGQARDALTADPGNSYLSSHLSEARRRKLDLLRRATALTSDMD
jgi:anti-sigma factor RsiW